MVSTRQAIKNKLPKSIRSLNELLPYRTYCKESDLYLNENSQGFMLELSGFSSDSNKIKCLIGMFSGNEFSQECSVQILQYASPRVDKIYDRWKSARNSEQAALRVDYYKSSTDLTIRDYRTFICVSLPKGDVSQVKLRNLRIYLQTFLGSLGIDNQLVKPDEFLNLMHELLYPNSDESVEWDRDLSLQDQIKNPHYIYDFNNPEHIDISGDRGATRVQCFSVLEYPQMFSQAENIDLLPQFTGYDRIECPFIKVYSFKFGNQDTKALGVKLLKCKSSSKSQEHSDLSYVLKSLSEGEKLVDAFYQVILFSDPDGMQRNGQHLKNLYCKKGWTLASEKFVQMQSWQSMLPFSFSEGLYEECKSMGRLNKHLTSVSVNVAPLEACSKGDKDPYMMFFSKHGKPLFFNPFENEGGNYNVCILSKVD